jgi:hypothetical protein
VFCPTTRLRKAEGVRLRPMEEWHDQCFVYAPGRGLHLMNLTGWFLLQGCDGRTLQAVRDEFVGRVRTQRWANRAADLVDSYFEDLWRRGLIVADGAGRSARQ